MKKYIIRIMGILLFSVILFFDISLKHNTDDKSKIKLKNIEALACYSLDFLSDDGEATHWWYCCYPWIPYCYLSGGVNMNGTIVNM